MAGKPFMILARKFIHMLTTNTLCYYLFSGRHYYWCLESDKVSWFPPGHPKACPVVSAAKVRENITPPSSTEEKEQDKEIVRPFYLFIPREMVSSFYIIRAVSTNPEMVNLLRSTHTT